jgi:hypothetical protein
MNEVEVGRFPKYLFQHQGMMRHGVFAQRIQPKRPRAHRHEPGIGYRIATGE